MKIRFCEFCGNVLREEPEYCDICGSRLIQEVEEEQFNDPEFPWPFEPVLSLCLRIQGQARHIQFSGTHSLYHLWSGLYEVYDRMELYFRTRKDEMELAEFAEGCALEEYRILEPGDLINCRYNRFSFYTFAEADPELELEPGMLEMTYQGSFAIENCPEKQWGNVLGWLLATRPDPRPEEGWNYDI